jgi:hypothetical protein
MATAATPHVIEAPSPSHPFDKLRASRRGHFFKHELLRRHAPFPVWPLSSFDKLSSFDRLRMRWEAGRRVGTS